MKLSLRHSTIFVLSVCICISSFFHIYHYGQPDINEDEAAQGYNTYSVVQTGRDEYEKIPIRYLSFGENKLPVTGLLSAPLIALFGLNADTIRLPVQLIGISMPILMYLLLIALFQKRSIGYVGAFLTSTNVWIHTMSRHQHEAVVLLAIIMIYLIVAINLKKNQSVAKMVFLALLYFVGLYTYHSAKIIMPVLAVWTLILIWKNSRFRLLYLFSAIIATGLFLFTEYLAPNTRVGQLSYFTSSAFVYGIEEGRRTGGSVLLYNKFSYAIYTVLSRLSYYLSPSFLIFGNDANPRYGNVHISLVTYAEYLLASIGLIIYWIKKQAHRIAIVSLFGVSIIPAIATISSQTSTRNFTLVLPIILSASYGLILVMNHISNQKIRYSLYFILIVIHLSSLYSSWHYYFDKYLTDPKTLSATQAGMKEVALTAWSLSQKYKTVYISNRYGQAYINMLLYGGPVDPKKYQSIAKIQPYNEYGFWEQPKLTDKFIFHIPSSLVSDAVIIVSADELSKYPYLVAKPSQTIASAGHPLFYVYHFD